MCSGKKLKLVQAAKFALASSLALLPGYAVASDLQDRVRENIERAHQRHEQIKREIEQSRERLRRERQQRESGSAYRSSSFGSSTSRSAQSSNRFVQTYGAAATSPAAQIISQPTRKPAPLAPIRHTLPPAATSSSPGSLPPFVPPGSGKSSPAVSSLPPFVPPTPSSMAKPLNKKLSKSSTVLAAESQPKPQPLKKKPTTLKMTTQVIDLQGMRTLESLPVGSPEPDRVTADSLVAFLIDCLSGKNPARERGVKQSADEELTPFVSLSARCRVMLPAGAKQWDPKAEKAKKEREERERKAREQKPFGLSSLLSPLASPPPLKPFMFNQSLQKTFDIELTQRYKYLSKDGILLFAYGMVPPMPPGYYLDAQRTLDLSGERAFTEVNARINSQVPCEISGYQARQVQGSLPERKGMATARFVLAHDRLYEIAVVGTPEFVNSPRCRKFIDSLHIYD